MSQDFSNNQLALSSGEDELSPQPSLVESYADDLMDELFEDVDRVLDGGITLPTEPLQPEYVSLQPISVPHIVLSPRMRRELTPELADGNLDTLVAESASYSEQRRGSGKSFDKLLLGAACVSLVVTLGLWLFSQKIEQQASVPVPVPPTAAELKAAEDAEFLEYMQRSLQTIDQKAQVSTTNTQVAVNPSNPAVQPAAVPTVPINGSAPVPGQPTVLERVYVPVYQPPQALYSTPIFPAGVTPTAPMPVAPVPVAPPPVVSGGTVPNIATAGSHTLVGIMSLGDRSAALFSINGVTQRIQIGENIGSSGWTLVSISNQEAIVRRNGEVRSVYVGQGF